MDVENRLCELSSLMDYEPAEDIGCQKLSKRQSDSVYVSRAVLPNAQGPARWCALTALSSYIEGAVAYRCRMPEFIQTGGEILLLPHREQGGSLAAAAARQLDLDVVGCGLGLRININQDVYGL